MNVLMFTKIYYSSWTTAAVNGGKELPILNTIALGQQNIRHQHPFQGMYSNENVLSSHSRILSNHFQPQRNSYYNVVISRKHATTKIK